MIRYQFLTLLAIPVVALLSSGIASQKASKQNAKVIGIDHIPIVVRNLDSAAAMFKQMGFALKPGRFHANGIKNQHVKFKDGTELELITAPQPNDTLSTKYYYHLKEGEGPAYFGLYSKDIPGVAKQLEGYKRYDDHNGSFISFPPTDPFHLLFFGGRNIASTDKPEHFAHTNSANKVIAVWLATNNTAQYIDLFQKLGIEIRQQPIKLNTSPVKAQIAKLEEGEVILLPASNQVTPNHPIMGVTVRVESIEAVKASLQKAGMKMPAIVKGEHNTMSLFLPPQIAHGIWLEFRQL